MRFLIIGQDETLESEVLRIRESYRKQGVTLELISCIELAKRRIRERRDIAGAICSAFGKEDADTVTGGGIKFHFFCDGEDLPHLLVFRSSSLSPENKETAACLERHGIAVNCTAADGSWHLRHAVNELKRAGAKSAALARAV